MTQYERRYVARRTQKIPARPHEARDRHVSIEVRRHENEVASQVVISGAAPGPHTARIRFDDGDGRFGQTSDVEWHGDVHRFELQYVPVAFIASVDGSDEIRS